MSCSNPLYALRLGAINPKTGKERIKVLPRNAGDYFSLCCKHGNDSILILPCGRCPSCIEKRSKTWALRCVLEASQYSDNCFLTLTYNNKCLPDGLCKKDLKDFLRRLRRNFPGVRYYACGEYGEHTKRPHYHLIVFNFFPDDAHFEKKSRYEGNYYTSKKLQDLWPFGFVSVGDCSFASCAYVARYCQKKIDDKKNFCFMSRHPGIGENYFINNYKFIYKYDKIIGDFGSLNSMNPGRYFDKLFEKIEPEKYEILKAQRIDKGHTRDLAQLIENGFEYYEQMLNHDRDIKAVKFSRLKRKGV